MKNINSTLDGKSAEELKKVAEELRSGKTDLDFEWRSEKDRKCYAAIIEKVAELKDICPAIQGCFALECDIDGDNNCTRHSPSLVVSDDTILSDATTKEEERANAYATRCELVAEQAGLLADEVREPVEAALGDIASACFYSRKRGNRMEIRLHTLESVLPIIDPLVDIKSEATAAICMLMLKQALTSEGSEEDDKDESNEAPQEPSKEETESEGKKRPVKIVELEGDAAEEALREIISKIGEKENKDDGECGGSCCRKCSKNKNS